MKDDTVKCPLVNEYIEIGECMVCADVASRMLKEECISRKFRTKKDWRDICQECEYHEM